jgi:hypothetical protein
MSTRLTSVIHQILGLRPGCVPYWICARSRCLPFDACTLVIVGLGYIVLASSNVSWLFGSVMVVALLLFILCVERPFRSAE